jgi:hypothetical protein
LSLADRLTLRWVHDGTVLIVFDRLIHLHAPALDYLTRRIGGDHVVAPFSDLVSSPRPKPNLPRHEVVLGLEELLEAGRSLRPRNPFVTRSPPSGKVSMTVYQKPRWRCHESSA